MQECQQIDSSRDIFGRARFQSHREDMSGVGSFMHETRTLLVKEFRMPTSQDPIT